MGSGHVDGRGNRMRRLPLLLTGLGLGLLACTTSNPRQPETAALENHSVRYEVYCGGGCRIWFNEDRSPVGDMNENNPTDTWDGPGPWRHTFLAPSGTELRLRASANHCRASVRVAIWVDDRERGSDSGSCGAGVRIRL